jgi:biotin-(acetyl-CoA carboxylase) ligase
LQELETTGTNKILEFWFQYDALYGKKLQLICGDVKDSGIAVGINQHGHLKIQNEERNIKAYTAGEVQLTIDN